MHSTTPTLTVAREPLKQTVQRIAKILEATTLQSGSAAVADNLRRCYEQLVHENIFPATELQLVDAWLQDLSMSG